MFRSEDAGALCAGRAGGMGSGGEVLLWEVRVSRRKDGMPENTFFPFPVDGLRASTAARLERRPNLDTLGWS